MTAQGQREAADVRADMRQLAWELEEVAQRDLLAAAEAMEGAILGDNLNSNGEAVCLLCWLPSCPVDCASVQLRAAIQKAKP